MISPAAPLRELAENGHQPLDQATLAEWDYAHTDYATPATRPGPVGLADSESDWRRHLAEETPNGELLRHNAMLEMLASGQPIYLMHTTAALDLIRSSGHLTASPGCLVGALYCAPLAKEPDGLRPHNLGSYLLETKRNIRTLVFEIVPAAPVPAKGLDYLRLGGIHLRTYLTHRSSLTEGEDATLRRAVVERVHAAADFLQILLANARGTLATPDTEFVDRLAAAVPAIPVLGYLYFEVVSEYLMLHSATTETRSYAEHGEMNTRLSKQLAFAAVASMGHLFNPALFCPDDDQLRRLVGRVEPGLAAGAARYARRRLPHLFACLALDLRQDAASVSFHDGMDFDALVTAAPHLTGQLVFRDMRSSERYPQLYPIIEQAKALEAYTYWNAHRIPTPFNGRLPKGEIGINPAHPSAGCTVWVAEVCERGLLHPAEELDVVFLPRLTDLHLTALGKAAFSRGH